MRSIEDLTTGGAAKHSKFLPAALWILLFNLLVVACESASGQTAATALSSWPPDRKSYTRNIVPEDFLGTPTTGETPKTLAVTLFLCDVVVSNTDSTLNSSDTFGDEEPSIAINPANTNEIVITAFSGFWGANAPWWHSTNGGLRWTKRSTIPIPPGPTLGGPEDQSIDYGRSNQLAGVFLASTTNTDVYAGISTNPASGGAFNWPVSNGVALPADLVAPGNNDQPWLLVNPDPINPSQDNVYVAYDDFGGSPDMRVSVAPGGNPPYFTIDSLVGFSTGFVNPGQRMAKDPRKGYIYSLWQRRIAAGSGGSQNINFMLNRSINGGVSWSLNGSATGIIVGNGDSTQPRPKFGTVNALLGGVDHAAVDPSNSDVYYVHAKRDSATGNNRLVCQRLTDNGAGGLSVGPEGFVTGQVQAALPSVAVNSSSAVAVLYDTYDGMSNGLPRFTAHVAVSTDFGVSFSDVPLYSFLSASSDDGDPRQRVLGDYQEMKSVGTVFYGVFTGNGAQLGRPIANHDPIFFKFSVGAAPSITLQPTNQTVFQGDTTSMVVGATGPGTLFYQWLFNGTPISGGTQTVLPLPNVSLSQAGVYSVVVSNFSASITSSNATLTVIPTVPLPVALNATNLIWTTSGDSVWRGLTTISHDGVAAAQSGSIFDGQQVRLNTSVAGPGTLTFWWKVSSESDGDGLAFSIGGVNQASISGEVDWVQQTNYLGAGTHPLQWTYAKDASGAAGLDAGWVDQVSYIAGGTAPFILTQPLARNVLPGDSVTFNVAAAGTPALFYQWRFNGAKITGETNSSVAIGSASFANDGLYSVVVSNTYGSITSSVVTLSIAQVAAWGNNDFGQVEIPTVLTHIAAIAAGGYHSLAVSTNGTVAAWGDDYNGQSDVPAGLSNVVAVAAGGYHSLALRGDGTVIGWGDNTFGQTNIPAGATNICAISAGDWHSLALRADGKVLAWGDNESGQTNVPPMSNIVAIAAGGEHNLALRPDGTVTAWGSDQLQNGGYGGQTEVPAGLGQVVAIAAGESCSMALKADGSLVAWGDNSQGQRTIPVGLSNAVSFAEGGSHALAVRQGGAVAAWGDSTDGESAVPANLINASAVAAGWYHSLVLFGSTPPGPRLATPTHVSGITTLAIPTIRGKAYFVEYKALLTAPSWNWLSAVSGNGAVRTVTDPGAQGANRFYRVRQQ